ncbi:MAG: hypothetical protein QM820_48375 [Minicystis sp.]
MTSWKPRIAADRLGHEERRGGEDHQPIAGLPVGLDALHRGRRQIGLEVRVVQLLHEAPQLRQAAACVGPEADEHRVPAGAHAYLAQEPGAHQLGEDPRLEQPAPRAREGAEDARVVPDEGAVEIEESDRAHAPPG